MSKLLFQISIDTIRYGNHTVLQNIELPLYENEIVTFVGPSGIGKTQLLKWVQKNYQSHLSAAFVFQGHSLFPWLTLKENLLISLHESVDPAKVDDILKEFQLSNFSEHYPSEVSGGMAQRINLARAILWPGHLMLLDEPFTGLDYFQKEELKKFTLGIISKFKKTALFVTHDIDEAVEFSDKIYLLNGNPATIQHHFNGMRFDDNEQMRVALRKEIRRGFKL